jgi:hypothetical protein
MGGALAAFAGIRAAVSLLRHNYLPPNLLLTPLPANYVPQVDGLVLDSKLANAAGRPIDFPATCGSAVNQALNACLRHNGIVNDLILYQPADRLPAFRLIESGIFVVLAIALFAVTWLWLRRSTVRGAR